MAFYTKETTLSNGCEATVNFEHEHRRKPRFHVWFSSEDEEWDMKFPKDLVKKDKEDELKREKAVQTVERILNRDCALDFDEKDARKIYEAMEEVKEKQVLSEADLSDKMTFKGVLTAIFRNYQNEVQSHHLPNGQLKTRCYIDEHDGNLYFCIPYGFLQDLLDNLETGWKRGKFKETVMVRCALHTTHDDNHKGLYQCPSRQIPWSLHIRMTNKFFGAGEIEFAGKQLSAGYTAGKEAA